MMIIIKSGLILKYFIEVEKEAFARDSLNQIRY